MRAHRNKRRLSLKVLSFCLSLLIMFGCLPTADVLAESQARPCDYVPEQEMPNNADAELIVKEKDKDQLQAELDNMVCEIETLREENVKHFQLADGTYQAVVYGQPVHRLNDSGEWEDIDNSLSAVGDEIITNNARIKFAKKITGNERMFTLHEGKYKVSFGLKGADKKVEGRYTNPVTDFDENASMLQKLTTLDNLSANILYENILPGVDIEYILESNDIKENIIVNALCDTYSYTFFIKLNGLDAMIVDKSVVLFDTTTLEEVYRIPAPYMYDASGEMSNDVHYGLNETGNGNYELVVTADEQWINASEREFPVVIDPTLMDIAQVADTYVSYNEPNENYGLAKDLWVSDYHEAYYKFTTPTLPNGATVSYASVKIPYYYFVVNQKYMSMGIYQITGNWNEHTVTWNTKPSLASTAITAANLYADGVDEETPEYATYYVTSYVKSWYSGTPNYGFALKRTGGTNYSILLISREKIKKYAQLHINYEQLNLGQGVYAVNNSNTNKYLKSYINKSGLSWLLQDTSHTSAPVSSNDKENLFKISYRPQYDDYIIRSMIDSSLVIYPSVYNNAPVEKRMTVGDNELSMEYGWKLISSFPNYYITYTSAGVTYYVKSVSDENNDVIRFTTDPSENGTKWYFTHYTGNVIEEVVSEDYIYSLYAGESYQYKAQMRSTRIGHNGPVRFSVTNVDGSATDKATINATTGELQALKAGQIHLLTTYPGSPWVWGCTVTIKSYGCKPYNEIWQSDTDMYENMNCHGYAFWTTNYIASYYWLELTATELNSCQTSEDLLWIIKEDFEENWLDGCFGENRWEDVTNDGGINATLAENQWLVVMRVGLHMNYKHRFDYHFWYRTNTGEWVNKHGYSSESEKLGSDLPTTNDSDGWSLDEYRNYYDSSLVYYRVTE